MGITIKDIARESNVSVTTVSRVINNKPDVSIETRKRILRLISERGYNPNGIARGLVLQKTNTIGLIIPDISNPFFPEVALGIESKAKEMGYSVIFCNTNNDNKAENEAIELLKSKCVDGMIVSLNIANKEQLDILAQERFPVVQIDRKLASSCFPTVTINDLQSAYDAVKHLLDLGHVKIAHITGNPNTQTARDRLKGFNTIIDEFKLVIKDDWIQEGDYSRTSGYEKMKLLLNAKEKPTAVFAANDLMAIGAYEAILEQGLRIPHNISIIGHDDIELASIIRPALTTMSIDKRKFGEIAAEILINGIENANLATFENITLNTSLVIRDSTKELTQIA